jgi:hypothetical protein
MALGVKALTSMGKAASVMTHHQRLASATGNGNEPPTTRSGQIGGRRIKVGA